MKTPFGIPGVPAELVRERDECGRLVRLSARGRVYFEQRDGERIFDGGFAVVSEIALRQKIVRKVRAAGQTWSEEYRWDDRGMPTWIDATEVRRDAAGRVTACIGESGTWHYAYAGEHLAAIESPRGIRHMARGENGRPVRVRDGSDAREICYDESGRRREIAPLPAGWQRDSFGRLWTITAPDGEVTATFLWEGFTCLGRIDGPLGEPLAAVFSLDPTATPVRVITRKKVTRIPRDAFGEALLDHAGVPGLHGGAVSGGFVHLRARVLDPRTGAFDSPDPWHGQEEDPRRTRGFRGPLVVEEQKAGRYAVCRNDPISRVDPTGEMSFWIWLSDFTWSLTNNLVGWLGLDWWLNSLALFQARDFFNFSGLHAKFSEIFGVRHAGLLAAPGAVWTFQHLVFAQEKEFTELAVAHLFAPTECDPALVKRFTLYGTLLRCEPAKKGDAFVLRGSGHRAALVPPRAANWTQLGGQATPVYPGSLVPCFPAGGTHFDTRLDEVPAPQDAVLTELEPDGTIVRGAIEMQARISVSGIGLGVGVGEFFLVTEKNNQTHIVEVANVREEGGATKLRVKGDGMGALAKSTVTVRGLAAPVAVPAQLNAGPDPKELKAPAPPPAFAAQDALRLKQGGTIVGNAVVDGFAAQLELADSFPASLPAHASVALFGPVGMEKKAKLTADNAILDLRLMPAVAAVNPPGKGDAITVTNGAMEVAAVITEVLSNDRLRLEPDLSAIGGAAGDEVKWHALSKTRDLGAEAQSISAGSKLLYRAIASGSAPAVGFALVAAGSKRFVRRISRVEFDVLTLKASLPGAIATPYDVEQLAARKTNADQSKLQLEPVRVFTPAAAPGVGANAKALMLLRFTAAAPLAAAATGITGATFAGNVATLAAPGAAGFPGIDVPTPGQLVQLKHVGGAVLAIANKVRLSFTLDRALPGAAGAAGLELVLLGDGGPPYDTTAQDAQNTTVMPAVKVGGVPRDTQMPRFAVGEIVQARWAAAPASAQTFRVAAVEARSTTLRLEQGAGMLPIPSPADLTIRRLVAVDPRTGGTRAGIEGTIDSADRKQVTFNVWSPAQMTSGSRVVVVDNHAGQAFPAVVDHVDSVRIDVQPESPLAATPIDIEIPMQLSADYAGAITREGMDIVTPAGLLAAAAAGEVVVVVPFKESARAVPGRLSAGTVKVPLRLADRYDLTREEALTEHELHHTKQSAELGPILLSYVPIGLIEGIVELVKQEDRQQFSDAWQGFFQKADATSPGGVMNLVAGSTYAAWIKLIELLFRLLAKLFTGDFPASVFDDSGEPSGDLDSVLERKLGLGWLSILFDPYGQIDYRVVPERDSFWATVTRLGRTAFGSKSWALTLFFGYAFYDNLRRQWGFLGSKPYLSTLESGASFHSGDTYTPLGLLRGASGVTKGLSGGRLLVGDVAYFWHLPTGGSRVFESLLQPGRQAAPGVHFLPFPRLMPFVDVPGAPGLDEPNRGAEIDTHATNPALAVPDAFISKNVVDPALITLAPRSFAASDRGWIPATAELERACGIYVAFTQASSLQRHRVTVVGVAAGDAREGREAQEEGKAELFRDVTVEDVTVAIGGKKVAEGEQFSLLPMQRAGVEVAPGGVRQYEVTMLRPSVGDVQIPAGHPSLQAGKVNVVPQPLEITRVYRFDTAKRSFDGGGLLEYGLHLPADLHIAVRQMKVRIDSTLPVHDRADPNADDLSLPGKSLTAGQEAIMLVPATIRRAAVGATNPTITVTYIAGVPPTARLPVLAVSRRAVAAATPAPAKEMLKFGGEIVAIPLPQDDPPEDDATVTCTIQIGAAAADPTLTTAFKLAPHFRLTPAVGADFRVKQGDTLRLTCSDGVTPGNVAPIDGVQPSTSGADVILKVDVAATLGLRQVRVTDKNKATHKARRTIEVIP